MLEKVRVESQKALGMLGLFDLIDIDEDRVTFLMTHEFNFVLRDAISPGCDGCALAEGVPGEADS